MRGRRRQHVRGVVPLGEVVLSGQVTRSSWLPQGVWKDECTRTVVTCHPALPSSGLARLASFLAGLFRVADLVGPRRCRPGASFLPSLGRGEGGLSPLGIHLAPITSVATFAGAIPRWCPSPIAAIHLVPGSHVEQHRPYPLRVFRRPSGSAITSRPGSHPSGLEGTATHAPDTGSAPNVDLESRPGKRASCRLSPRLKDPPSLRPLSSSQVLSGLGTPPL